MTPVKFTFRWLELASASCLPCGFLIPQIQRVKKREFRRTNAAIGPQCASPFFPFSRKQNNTGEQDQRSKAKTICENDAVTLLLPLCFLQGVLVETFFWDFFSSVSFFLFQENKTNTRKQNQRNIVKTNLWTRCCHVVAATLFLAKSFLWRGFLEISFLFPPTHRKLRRTNAVVLVFLNFFSTSFVVVFFI